MKGEYKKEQGHSMNKNDRYYEEWRLSREIKNGKKKTMKTSMDMMKKR